MTFTATVSVVSPGGGIPSGTVTFEDGSSPIGTGTLTPTLSHGGGSKRHSYLHDQMSERDGQPTYDHSYLRRRRQFHHQHWQAHGGRRQRRITTLASFNGTNGADPGGLDRGQQRQSLRHDRLRRRVNGDGTVFEIAAGSGTITTLASFNGTNGVSPNGGLVEDSSGNLFGTTMTGGANR